MYYVYILQCVGDNLYTGITNNLKARFRQHKDGKGSKYVRAHLPFKLVYLELHPDRSSASKREYEIKQLEKDEKKQLISKFVLQVKVKVFPGSSRQGVEGMRNEHLIVRLNKSPVGGMANKELVEILSKYFCVPKRRISIIHGFKSKRKVIEMR